MSDSLRNEDAGEPRAPDTPAGLERADREPAPRRQGQEPGATSGPLSQDHLRAPEPADGPARPEPPHLAAGKTRHVEWQKEEKVHDVVAEKPVQLPSGRTGRIDGFSAPTDTQRAIVQEFKSSNLVAMEERGTLQRNLDRHARQTYGYMDAKAPDPHDPDGPKTHIGGGDQMDGAIVYGDTPGGGRREPQEDDVTRLDRLADESAAEPGETLRERVEFRQALQGKEQERAGLQVRYGDESPLYGDLAPAQRNVPADSEARFRQDPLTSDLARYRESPHLQPKDEVRDGGEV